MRVGLISVFVVELVSVCLFLVVLLTHGVKRAIVN